MVFLSIPECADCSDTGWDRHLPSEKRSQTCIAFGLCGSGMDERVIYLYFSCIDTLGTLYTLYIIDGYSRTYAIYVLAQTSPSNICVVCGCCNVWGCPRHSVCDFVWYTGVDIRHKHSSVPVFRAIVHRSLYQLVHELDAFRKYRQRNNIVHLWLQLTTTEGVTI